MPYIQFPLTSYEENFSPLRQIVVVEFRSTNYNTLKLKFLLWCKRTNIVFFLYTYIIMYKETYIYVKNKHNYNLKKQ